MQISPSFCMCAQYLGVCQTNPAANKNTTIGVSGFCQQISTLYAQAIGPPLHKVRGPICRPRPSSSRKVVRPWKQQRLSAANQWPTNIDFKKPASGRATRLTRWFSAVKGSQNQKCSRIRNQTSWTSIQKSQTETSQKNQGYPSDHHEWHAKLPSGKMVAACDIVHTIASSKSWINSLKRAALFGQRKLWPERCSFASLSVYIGVVTEWKLSPSNGSGMASPRKNDEKCIFLEAALGPSNAGRRMRKFRDWSRRLERNDIQCLRGTVAQCGFDWFVPLKRLWLLGLQHLNFWPCRTISLVGSQQCRISVFS